MRRHRRGNQHGQVMVITALLAVILVGAAALAIDLSVQTGNRRELQNVADVAALAGARDLYSTSTTTISSADQTAAVADAMLTLQRNMGWPGTWLSDAGASLDDCAGFPPATFTTYGLTGHCEQAHYNSYTVTVSTPPMSPRTLGDMDPHNLQVDMTETSQNGLAGVIGFGTSQQGGHAVAGHVAGGNPIGFALFSNTYVQGGNQRELVNGNVYANRAVQPQSSGNSAFCAQSTAGNDDGYIILATPQTAASGGQPAQTHAPAIATTTDCNTVSSGIYQQGLDVRASPPSCPSLPGMPDVHLSYNSTVGACVTLPLTPPSAAPPPLSGTVTQISQQCTGGGGGNGNGHRMASCWSSSTVVPPGIYVVNHTNTPNNPCVPTSCWDLLITGSMSLSNVTFWLKPGATMGLNISGSGGSVTDSAPYNAGTGQPDDGRFAVYGEAGSNLYIVGANTTLTFTKGSIFMPGGSVFGESSSAALYVDAGQAVVDNWQVNTGNQSNPEITQNAAYDAVSQETLRLLE